MLHVEYWHQLMPLYFCQINIISRHKESSINRPSKRYATFIFFYTPPHNKWGRMWLNCKVNWHLIVLESSRDRWQGYWNNYVYAYKWPISIEYQQSHSPLVCQFYWFLSNTVAWSRFNVQFIVKKIVIFFTNPTSIERRI